jgi:hypothetical protein
MVDTSQVSTMNYSQCMERSEDIKARVIELQMTRADELREKWASEAAALGLDAEVLLRGGRGARADVVGGAIVMMRSSKRR